MHKRIITILLLLPLVILIGLPCSMKQDFKHLLGIFGSTPVMEQPSFRAALHLKI